MVTASKKATEVKAAAPVAKKVATPKAAAVKKVAPPKVAATPAAAKVATSKAKAPKAATAEKAAPAAKIVAKKPAKVTTPKTKATATRAPAVSPEHRYHMIATAAYFIAQNRGSASGYEMQDWISAEAQIDLQLS